MEMDLSAARSSIHSLPGKLITKHGRPVSLRLLKERCHGPLVDMYLAFRPRNCFQGLPPLRDEVCEQWVRQMIDTGINLIATSGADGVVGHAALFPVNPRKCEMLVVVRPEFQNAGIGTALVQSSMRVAGELGFQRIWLPVEATNVRARRVYEKCHFRYASSQLAREVEMACDVPRFAPADPPRHAPPAPPTFPLHCEDLLWCQG
jgi:diamine N-acetyltransferase